VKPGHSSRFVALVDAARPLIREAGVNRIHARLAEGEDFHLVDVREESEWAAARIAGAIHVGRGVLERDIEKHVPDLDAEIVLYCGGGYRSALAAESLLRMGFTRVTSMAGGFRGWREAGYAVEEAPAGEDEMPQVKV
jgi:rhodanese-related sulfurtransferase